MYFIKVKHQEAGDPRRGYHNCISTVEFTYTDPQKDGWQEAKKEKEIVSVILNEKHQMWFDYIKEEEQKADFANQFYPEKTNSLKVGATYVVRHGVDSGD